MHDICDVVHGAYNLRVPLPEPTVELVLKAEAEFDRENSVAESAVALVFGQYPGNNYLVHVLVKVAVLNQLYRTNIFDVGIAAERIANLPNLDEFLTKGAPQGVDLIADIKIGTKPRVLLSFATKYCSWHNQGAYPIFDVNVDKCLWAYKKQDRFTDYASNYCSAGTASQRRENFFSVVTAFRQHYGLNSVNFKQLDKFLYLQGRSLAAKVKAQHA